MSACCCSLAGTNACGKCPNAPMTYRPFDPMKTFWQPAPKSGWECPKCGAVYSPQTPQCFRCTGEVTK